MTPVQEPTRDEIQAIRERIHRRDSTLSRGQQLRTSPLWGALSRVVRADEIEWAAFELDSDPGQHPAGTLRVLSQDAVLEVPFRTASRSDGSYELEADQVAVSPLKLKGFQMHVDDSDADWGTPPTVTVTLDREAGASIVLHSHSDWLTDAAWDPSTALKAYARSLFQRISGAQDPRASA